MSSIVYFKEKADTKICLFSVLYITSLIANLTVGYRYINLGSFVQSGGILIFPISFIISDILTEIYGTNLAKKLVYYGAFSQFIFALYAFFVIRMPAPVFLAHKEIYYEVFNPYLKFAFASSFSVIIGSWVNIVLLSKLSERISGNYFALRSFIASTLGEFLVTVISMLIANLGRMEPENLIYMIFCCFLTKTIISFISIWPAAIIVYKIENKNNEYDISIKNMKRPIYYLRNIILAAWHAKGYVYTLELINLHTKKAYLYYKGTRGIIQLSLEKIVSNIEIINRSSSVDAAHIGYYFVTSDCNDQHKNNSLFQSKNIYLIQGVFNIISINRDGTLNIKDKNSHLIFTKKPKDLYYDKNLMGKFPPLQALYIGYLSGLEVKIGRKIATNNKHHLKLVKTNGI